MLVKTDYKDKNNSIYKCDMCDKEINNKHITRYQKFIYSNKSRYSRFTNIDKFDLCPRCEKYLNKMNTYNMDKMYESYADTVERMQMWLDESERENKQLKEHIEKYEHYCKTTGIEELMKENQKYKKVIDKAIKLIEKIKERRILRLLEMEVLDILKEVE